MAHRLLTHPGVGALTALAFELVIGTPLRFPCGKQIARYVGLVPAEQSSGERRRLGHISKQGNVLLRFLLVEAAQVTVRSQQEGRHQFFHLAMRRGRKIAKVAMARKLAVHRYWMWRQGCDYGAWQKLGLHAGVPGNPDGERGRTEFLTPTIKASPGLESANYGRRRTDSPRRNSNSVLHHSWPQLHDLIRSHTALSPLPSVSPKCVSVTSRRLLPVPALAHFGHRLVFAQVRRLLLQRS